MQAFRIAYGYNPICLYYKKAEKESLFRKLLKKNTLLLTKFNQLLTIID